VETYIEKGKRVFKKIFVVLLFSLAAAALSVGYRRVRTQSPPEAPFQVQPAEKPWPRGNP
jgi:hypothetical protein